MEGGSGAPQQGKPPWGPDLGGNRSSPPALSAWECVHPSAQPRSLCQTQHLALTPPWAAGGGLWASSHPGLLGAGGCAFQAPLGSGWGPLWLIPCPRHPAVRQTSPFMLLIPGAAVWPGRASRAPRSELSAGHPRLARVGRGHDPPWGWASRPHGPASAAGERRLTALIATKCAGSSLQPGAERGGPEEGTGGSRGCTAASHLRRVPWEARPHHGAGPAGRGRRALGVGQVAADMGRGCSGHSTKVAHAKTAT